VETSLRGRSGRAVRLLLLVTVFTGSALSLSACNEDQQACNDVAGNGNYSPVTEDGNVYCENAFNGDRFLLRQE
jgi:hypothetical protein